MQRGIYTGRSLAMNILSEFGLSEEIGNWLRILKWDKICLMYLNLYENIF